MDKISGIIPSSARVAAVDMKDSPVRPGAPAFGRPQGASGTTSVTSNGEAMKKASEMFESRSDWRAKDTRQAELVNNVSNAFFMKKIADAAPETVAATAALQQPEGLYPRGSFIDREA